MMRRTPMKPGKGFASKAAPRREYDPDRVRSTPTPSKDFRLARPIDDHVEPVEKEGVIAEHGVYMQLVRMLPCAHCNRHGPSQFCHADMGKGIGIKTDCRRGFPGCPECHALLGSSGKIPRAERRELERRYGEQTRAKMLELKLWPRTLPLWREK